MIYDGLIRMDEKTIYQLDWLIKESELNGFERAVPVARKILVRECDIPESVKMDDWEVVFSFRQWLSSLGLQLRSADRQFLGFPGTEGKLWMAAAVLHEAAAIVAATNMKAKTKAGQAGIGLTEQVAIAAYRKAIQKGVYGAILARAKIRIEYLEMLCQKRMEIAKGGITAG